MDVNQSIVLFGGGLSQSLDQVRCAFVRPDLKSSTEISVVLPNFSSSVQTA